MNLYIAYNFKDVKKIILKILNKQKGVVCSISKNKL